MPGGAAAHRALAYLAHGSPLADGGTAISPIRCSATRLATSTIFRARFILCLAGVSVTLGLQNLLPHYLNRLGMDVSWAGKSGVIMHVLNVIVLLVTVVFRASPSPQQWAYATSVLVLLAGAALAAAKDLRLNAKRGFKRIRADFADRRRRRILLDHDRPHRADQSLRPHDRPGVRAGDSHQLVRLALDPQHGAAVRGLRIRRTNHRASAGTNFADPAQRCSCRIARA